MYAGVIGLASPSNDMRQVHALGCKYANRGVGRRGLVADDDDGSRHVALRESPLLQS